MNVDRLTVLKKALNKYEDNGVRFNMNNWIKDDWCGTITVCAMGLASIIPEFQKQGLYNNGLNVFYAYFDCSFGEKPEKKLDIGFMAASSFFNINIKDAQFLFSPVYYKSDVTAKTVARRIGMYIRTEGKSAQNAKFFSI